MNSVVITGASSGMGAEFARQMASSYEDIDRFILVARNEERLEIVKKEIENIKNVRVDIYCADLTNAKDCKKFSEYLACEKPHITHLINCAGMGKIGLVTEIPIEEQLRTIDINCKALVYTTYEVLKYMSAGSKIVELASSAGFMPQPGFNVYASSKSFVLSFSRALSRELKREKICVTAVCPGPVKTEFFKVAETTKKVASYKKKFMADKEKVVKKALKDMDRHKKVSVYGISIKLLRVISKVVPVELVLKIYN